MPDMPLVTALGEIEQSAHESYLKTWSIITQGAENNGEYSNELLYEVIANQQKIATDLNQLALLTADLVRAVQEANGKTITI